MVVDGDNALNTSPTSRSARDPDEWRLPSSDPRDPGASKYRIHTIDVYFWNHDDSKVVVDIVKRLLHPHQLDLDEIQEETPHHDMVSPVVQNLEKVAFSDPAYKGRQHDPTADTLDQPVQISPPPNAGSRTSAHFQATSASPNSVTASTGGRSTAAQAPASDYTPLAYNPAAPAAPEPIAHREDTPPPVDADDGTGLAAAAKHGHYRAQQHSMTYSGVPSAQAGAYGHYGSPPPSFGPHATASPRPSFGPQAAATVPQSSGPHAVLTPLPSSPRTSVSTSFAPPPSSVASDNSHHHSAAAQTYVPHPQDPNSHIFGPPPVETPGTQFYQSINGQPHKALQHVQPQYPDYLSAGQAPAPPLGGYSAYNYAHAQPQPAASGYDIHNQVYRPTEAEHQSHHSKPSKSSGSQHKPSHTERVEKGIGKWIKKVEKNFG